MHCYVSAVKQPDSAGRDLGANVPTCHATENRLVNISYHKRISGIYNIIKCLPAELFAADSQSWHVEPAGPAF